MKKILFVSHTFMGGPFVVGSHHLARTFSELGHKVIHLSTPVTPIHHLKKDNITKMKIARSNEINQINENLIDYIPFSIGLPWSMMRPIYNNLKINFSVLFLKSNIQKVIKSFFDTLEIDYLIIDQPTMVGIENLVTAKKIIYRATDLYAEMMNDTSILNAEKNIIKKADGLIGTSKPVLNHITAMNEELPSLLVENGVNFKHFSEEREMPHLYQNFIGKRAIYAGAIDERLDLNAIIDLAKSNPDVHTIVIGPLNDETIKDQYKNIKNLHFLGSVDYNDLPAYLQYADVALLPLSNHKANNGRSPMKLYEYLAAGLPVVTKKTDELVNRNEKNIYFYENINETVREVISLNLQKNDVKENIGKYGWEQKAKLVYEFAEKL